MQTDHRHPQNLADAIIAQLAAAGVQRIYGVIGDALFPFADALARQNAVQLIATTHEGQAAFMASYEAKLTGKLAVCIATAGPGATNLATGIADAHFDHAPVLIITGQVETKKIGTTAKQYFDQQGFMGSICSRSELVLSAKAALSTLVAGIATAVLERKVVHISIPKDVFTQPADWVRLPLQSMDAASGDRNTDTLSKMASPLAIGQWDRALDTLLASQRPLVLIGVTQRHIAERAVQLAHTLGAAVVAAQHAKGMVPFAEELLIGGIGEAHVPPVVAEADVILLIGNAPYELPFLSRHTPIIALNTRSMPIAEHTMLAEVVGDPLQTIPSLEKALASRTPDPAWTKAIHEARQALDQQIEQLHATSTAGPINPYRLAFSLSQAIAEDAIVTLDTGAFTHWFDLGFRAVRQDVLTSPHWRGMGAGLPAAIAAKLAAPERQVIGIIGDGGMLMSLSELITAVRYELPLLLIIVRNESYDIERQKMQAQGFATLGTPLRSPDYAAYARACGATGVTVHDTQDFEPTLHEALASLGNGNTPVLMDVLTSTPDLPHASP